MIFQVECSGPGIQENGVEPEKLTIFNIDTRKAGIAPLEINILDGNCNAIDATLSDNKDGTYVCAYKPKKEGKHTVQVC